MFSESCCDSATIPSIEDTRYIHELSGEELQGHSMRTYATITEKATQKIAYARRICATVLRSGNRIFFRSMSLRLTLSGTNRVVRALSK